MVGCTKRSLLVHGATGWALCAATMGTLLALTTIGLALFFHALAAPLIFTAVGRHYFLQRGARDPLPTALTFVAIVALLDLTVIAGLVQHSLAMFASVAGTWLPFLLIFVATWATGEVMSTMPRPKPPSKRDQGAPAPAHGHPSRHDLDDSPRTA